MRILLLLTMMFASVSYGREPLKVIVLDTGYKATTVFTPPLCSDWHYDATEFFAKKSATPPMDEHGHGTHIVSVIQQVITNTTVGLPGVNYYTPAKLEKFKKASVDGYCFVIVRYYKGNKATTPNNSYEKAIKYIETIPGPKLLNYSGGGEKRIENETKFVQKMMAQGVRIIAAAGNENKNIGPKPKNLSSKEKEKYSNYYPAQEPGVTAVGAYQASLWEMSGQDLLWTAEMPWQKHKKVYLYRLNQSNYGAAKIVWRPGVLFGAGLNNDIVEMRGTSQAAAVETGVVIQEYLQTLRRENELRENIERNQDSKRDLEYGDSANGPDSENEGGHGESGESPDRSLEERFQGRGSEKERVHPGLRDSNKADGKNPQPKLRRDVGQPASTRLKGR